MSTADDLAKAQADLVVLRGDIGAASTAAQTLVNDLTAIANDLAGQPPPPPPPTGQAGFGQPLMAAPAGVGAMFFHDTFQGGALDTTKWTNTMGSVNDWGNEPGYAGGSVSVVAAAAGGGVILDNSSSGPSSCLVTCQPRGAGDKLLVNFPEAGWYVQGRMKWSTTTNGFFPAFWLPPEGAGAEIDIVEGGWSGVVPDENAHVDYAATGGAGNQQQNVIDIGVDFSKSFGVFGCRFEAGVSCKFFVNGHEWDAAPPCPGTTTYNLAFTPQHAPGGGGGWHTQGPGTGKMYLAEVQAYAL